MTKEFKAGDKVRIKVGGDHYLDGMTGVIKLTAGNLKDYYGRHAIECGDEGTKWLGPEALELVEESLPRVIKFNDIRKGDLIRSTRKYDKSGGEIVATLRVFKRGESYSSGKLFWKSEDNLLVLHNKYTNASSTVLELLDRPKPELPTGTGSIIRVTKARGVSCDTLAMLDSSSEWVAAEEILGYSYLAKADIQEWSLMTAVPAIV
jgi:hypothetical protein